MRKALALLLIATTAGSGWASPPGQSPRPDPRPGVTAGAVALPGSAARPLIVAGVSPRPLARPGAAAEPAPRPVAPEKLVPVAAVPMKRQVAPARGQLCGIPGLAGREIAPITSQIKGCGLTDGVEVTHVSGIPLSNPAQIDCETASALKTWVDRAIVPAVGNRGGGVDRLEIAGSYACRPRNNQSGAKVSEHGRGRAVDLAGIRLRSGEVITVAQHWRSKYGPMLEKIHAMACGPFGTVLGPKADRFHWDHIHVDAAKGRSPYCR